MPLQFIDGFEYTSEALSESRWLETGTTLNSTAGFFRSGLTALGSVNSTDYPRYTYPTPNTSCTIGLAFYANTTGAAVSAFNIAYLGYGGDTSSDGRPTRHIGLRVTTTGKLVVWRPEGFTVLATSTKTLYQKSFSRNWNYIEWMVTCNNTTGNTEVRVNGETWISATGLDTADQYVPEALIDTVVLSGYGTDTFIDDVYIRNDATFMGDVKVVSTPASTGNGAMVDFIPSTGVDHGAMVDDTTPDEGSTYNYTTTAGAIDTYQFPALGVTGNVHAVQVNSVIRKYGFGSCVAAPVIRISSTNYTGTNTYPVSYNGANTGTGISSFEYMTQLYETNPATSSQWTVSDIDNAEFGLTRVV